MRDGGMYGFLWSWKEFSEFLRHWEYVKRMETVSLSSLLILLPYVCFFLLHEDLACCPIVFFHLPSFLTCFFFLFSAEVENPTLIGMLRYKNTSLSVKSPCRVLAVQPFEQRKWIGVGFMICRSMNMNHLLRILRKQKLIVFGFFQKHGAIFSCLRRPCSN